jgi:hypothetical protein
MDVFIAATAGCHDMDLVTRNIGDFEALGLCLIDPLARGFIVWSMIVSGSRRNSASGH